MFGCGSRGLIIGEQRGKTFQQRKENRFIVADLWKEHKDLKRSLLLWCGGAWRGSLTSALSNTSGMNWK